jgi:phosphate-selective porin OprO/OprP
MRSTTLTTAIAVALVATSFSAVANAQNANPASDDATLRAKVADLSNFVQQLSQRDQQQIDELSAQVKSLQTQLQQKEAANASNQTATPRAQHNATNVINETSGSTDSQIAEPRVVQNAAHRFELQSADGQYSIGLTGDIQMDAGGYNFRPDSSLVGAQNLSNGVNARRARIGVTGEAAGNFGFALVYDTGNSSDQTPKGIETAQVIYNGFKGFAAEFGYSNTFFTLDQSTSGNDTLFLERASPSNIATNFNAGDFRSNAGFRFFGDRYWVGGYLTGPAAGDSHTQAGERFGAFERAAFQALKGDDYSVHLGVGVDELFKAPNTGAGTADTMSLSDPPELRIDPTALLNTGTIGTLLNPVTGGYVGDFESAATYRNFFWQGEYYHYQIERQGLADNNFNGWYGQVSWTLTGEQHKYNPQAGSYFRIFPEHPFSFSNGGWGAWEIAARASYVDLTSNFLPDASLSKTPDAVDGGKQRAYALGLNWYPNDFVRLMLDFDHVDYDKANGSTSSGAALGTPVGAKLDAVALRVQVAY